MSRDKHIVILGNGVAGATTALEIRKRSDARITMVSGETDYPFSRTALMYLFMGDLNFGNTKLQEDWVWDKNNIARRRGWVRKIDSDSKRLEFESGDPLDYDVLVLATGAKANRFGWPGQDLKGVQSMISYQDLELLEKNVVGCRRAVVAGGGLIGVELAEMLLVRGIPVTFLVRESRYWGKILPQEEADLVAREIRRHGIDLRLGSEISEIFGNDQDRVKAVKLKSGEEIECDLVGITAGVSPNIDLLKEGSIECEKGILVDEYLQTSAPDVYAAGDCVQLRQAPAGRRPLEPIWYVGKIMGQFVAANVCGERLKYDPGVWFNSAKFFDIEYQTYGDAPAGLPDEIEGFYWESKDGLKGIRIFFRKADGVVIGMNTLGIRQRHAVWEDWILRSANITEVISELGAANFDPEFFPAHEEEIVSAFNSAHPEHRVELKTRKGLFSDYLRKLFGTETAAA